MKNIKILFLLAAIMASLMMCGLMCSAQTYSFTNVSKPVSVGKFSCTGQYTLEFDWLADTGTHKNRSVTLFTWSTQSASIQYPFLVYNGWRIPMNAGMGYQTLITGTHHWTFRIGLGLQEIVIDSFIIASRPWTTPVNINSDLIFSSSSDIDKLSGTITAPHVINSVMRTLNEKTITGVYDWRNFPPGYVGGDWSNVSGCYDQLAYAASIVKPVAPGTMKVHPMFDFYKAGGSDFLTADSAIKAGVMIAGILADKFNCDFRVIGNTQDWWSYKDLPNDPHGKFNNAMIAQANSHPEYELRVDCTLSQLDDLPGHPTIKTDQVAAMLPNEPIETFDNMAFILQAHYTGIQAKLLKPINYAVVDNEYFNNWIDTPRYARNVACNAAKIASGLSWWDYCSVQYVKDMNRMYDGIKRACPGIKIVEYDVNCLDECRWYYFPKFKYRVGSNTDGMGTDQNYPRNPLNLLVGNSNSSGDYRGALNYYMLSKRGQVKAGHPLNTPFYGAGYLGIPEVDINPTLTIGWETFTTLTGSPSGYPSLYVQGGNNPNPKSYAHQMISNTIAQSACVKVWPIILAGDLLPGDRSVAWLCFGNTNYTFWAGDYEVLVAVKKLGNTYAIAAWHGACTNFKSGLPYKKKCGIFLNGKYIELEARTQCSVYFYDEAQLYQPNQTLPNPNPNMVNQFVKFGAISNWNLKNNRDN